MTVQDMNKKDEYIIKNLNCDDKLRAHLIGMGLIPGYKIQLMMHRFGGYVIECLGGKFAMNKTIAKYIEVENV